MTNNAQSIKKTKTHTLLRIADSDDQKIDSGCSSVRGNLIVIRVWVPREKWFSYVINCYCFVLKPGLAKWTEKRNLSEAP